MKIQFFIFLKNSNCIISGYYPDTAKCKIAGIGILKGMQVAVFGIRCIDLKSKTIKILGIYFSYNQLIKVVKTFIMFQIFKVSWIYDKWEVSHSKEE